MSITRWTKIRDRKRRRLFDGWVQRGYPDEVHAAVKSRAEARMAVFDDLDPEARDVTNATNDNGRAQALVDAGVTTFSEAEILVANGKVYEILREARHKLMEPNRRAGPLVRKSRIKSHGGSERGGS